MTAPVSWWYCGTTKWTAVSIWTTGTVTAAGVIRRQTAGLGTLTVGNERVFICTVAGTTHATTEPTWILTKGAKTTDNTVTWMECTGQSGVNGDVTNTPAWSNANVKNTAIAQGLIIKDVAATTYFICTTAGTAGNGAEPTWNTVAGQTTADNTVTWTSLGAVGGFTAWGAPHARLANSVATNWQIGGDTIYVSNNHAETQTTTLTVSVIGSATANLHTSIICVSDTASPPTATATTGTVTTTGTSGITVGNAGANNCDAYIYGLTFNVGTGSGAVSGQFYPSLVGRFTFDNCTFNIVSTSATSVIRISTNATQTATSFLNCAFTFGAAGQAIVFDFFGNGVAYSSIIGGSIAKTGTAPTSAFSLNAITNINLTALVRDCDLSGATTNLINMTTAKVVGSFTFENCKLANGVALTTGTLSDGITFNIYAHNCDSTGTNYLNNYKTYYATQQSETTIIRTGGATDGTTPVSWNIVTTAGASFYSPFVSEEIAAWNDSTGSSRTATIEINSGGTLTNGDVWLEIEYLGSSATPLGSLATSRKSDILQSSTNITSSTATWAGGLAGSTPQKLQVSFTPQLKGPVKARVYVGKASQTVYIDPRLTISDAAGNIKSSGRQLLIPGQGYINETAPSLMQVGLTSGIYN